MLPIIIDGARLRLALVGAGDHAAKRMAWLHAAGASNVTLHTPGADLPAELPQGWTHSVGLPGGAALAGTAIVWITGLAEAEAALVAAAARAAGCLVNVEDVIAACDFHTPAVVRRGDLLLTVSTGGRSPGLAQAIRAWLEEHFGPEWSGRLDTVAHKRTAWRRRPRELPELAKLTGAVLDRQGWLKDAAP